MLHSRLWQGLCRALLRLRLISADARSDLGLRGPFCSAKLRLKLLTSLGVLKVWDNALVSLLRMLQMLLA
jgi:hypothetical protein